MASPRKDPNTKTAAQVAKITKTRLPAGESLLGSEELKRQLAEAKAHLQIRKR